jgi:hypothetical protein
MGFAANRPIRGLMTPARTRPGRSPFVPDDFLNPSQRRHVGSALRLLVDDLEMARATLPDESWAGAAGHILLAARERATVALKRLGLPVTNQVKPVQQLTGLAGIWLARLPDLQSSRLTAYGPVDPRAATALDPLIGAVSHELERLLAALGGEAL